MSKLNLRNRAEIIFGNENTANKFPVLNKIIAIYIGLSLIMYISSLIAPVLTFLTHTPIYHFKTYFGLLGAALICIDVFTNRGLWRGAYCWLMYGIAAIAAVSSLLTFSYGISDNLFKICWFVIEIALFYSLSFRLNKIELKRFVFIVYSIILVIWFIACLVSISQFITLTHHIYVADTVSQDSTPTFLGYLNNRLYGVFNPINHAAYISLMLTLIGIYFITKIKNIAVKIIYAIACFIVYMYVILSVSRSALVATSVVIVFIGFLIVRNKLKSTGFKKVMISGVSAILIFAVAFGCYSLVKTGATKLPTLYSSMTSDETVVTPNTESNVQNQELLDRNHNNDVTNARMQIWTDYISLYNKIGLLGLSPGNYMKHIKNNYPNLFIVEYIRINHPPKYNADVIFHTHNGYLLVFVATGFLGLFLLLCYLAFCIIKSLKYIIKNEYISSDMLLAFALVVAGCISAVFDVGVFLCDNGHTLIFWIAAGYLMKNSANKSIPNTKE